MVAAILNFHIGPGAVLEPIDQMTGGLPHAHNVIDPDPTFGGCYGIGAPRRLFRITQDKVDLGHGRKRRRIDLCRAAGDNQAGVRAFPPCLANGLTRLANSLRRHSTGVEDHRVFKAILGGTGADDLALIGIKPAAEGDNIDPGRHGS